MNILKYELSKFINNPSQRNILVIYFLICGLLSFFFDFEGSMILFMMLFSFLPALLVITTITNEYTHGTFRQHIISGLSTTRFVLAKSIFTLCLSTFLVVLFSIVLTFNELFDFSDLKFIFFVASIIYAFTLLSLLQTFAFFARKTGLTIALFILYCVLEMIFVANNRDALGYTPLSNIPLDLDLKGGFSRGFDSMSDINFSKLILSLVYSSAFITISCLVTRKRDLVK